MPIRACRPLVSKCCGHRGSSQALVLCWVLKRLSVRPAQPMMATLRQIESRARPNVGKRKEERLERAILKSVENVDYDELRVLLPALEEMRDAESVIKTQRSQQSLPLQPWEAFTRFLYQYCRRAMCCQACRSAAQSA